MAEPILLPRPGPGGTATYIGDMCRALAVLAKQDGLDTLGYLLDIARLEAENARAPDLVRDSD